VTKLFTKFTFTFYLLLFFSLSVFITACSDQEQSEASQFFLKGNLELDKKEYANAIRYYGEALQKKADLADVHNNRGIAYLRLSELEKALEDFNKAIEIDPKFEEAYFNRAGFFIDQQAFALATADLEHIRKTYGDSTNYYLKWGDLKFGQGYYEQALAEYDRALSLRPKNVQALVNRGVAYFEKKNFKAAKADFENAVKLDSLQQLAYNNLSLIFARENQPEQALKFIERALDFDPVNPIYLNNKGYVLLLQNQQSEAKKLIDLSLIKDPQNSYAHRNLGLYFLKNGQKDEALTAFQKAYQLSAATDQIHVWLGEALFVNNQKEEACRVWKKGEALGEADAVAKYRKNCK
jgi:tetratricopeptide (TPR) repeat protein